MGRRFLPGVIKSLVLGDHFAIQEIRGIGASFGTSGEGTNLNQHVSTATGNIIIDIVMYFSRIYSLKKTRRRMARERRGAGSSLVSMERPYYKTIY